jgi:hypothetical protein
MRQSLLLTVNIAPQIGALQQVGVFSTGIIWSWG